MSLLTKCAPSRWADFLTIPDDSIPRSSGEDEDLFVGKNKSVTITLRNGTETKFRDIVVLGQLTILSSDPANIATKPLLVARDFFSAKIVSLNNIHLKCRNYLQSTPESFRSELQELFLESLDLQRESAKRSGLISILI